MTALEWCLLAVAVLVIAWAAGILVLCLAGRRTDARAWATFIPDCLVLVRRLLGDPRVPRSRKLLLAGLVAYLALPFDLVPDFIPVAGQLDDAIVVALVLRSVLRAAGPELLEEHWPGPERSLSIVRRLAGSRRPISCEPEDDAVPRGRHRRAAMSTDAHASDTFPYPEGSVVAIVTDSDALEEARRSLAEDGFAVDVLHGEEGLARLDVDGAAHGSSGSLMRRLQSVLSDDAGHVREYAEHLEAGHYVVGVAVGEDDAAKWRAADALRASSAETLHYYAENYVEDL